MRRAIYLDGVEAAHDAPVLHLDVRRRVSEATLIVGPRALVARELAAHVQRQPSRVLDAGWRAAAAETRRSAAVHRRCSRCRRCRSGGRRRGVDDRCRTQHRVDDGHRQPTDSYALSDDLLLYLPFNNTHSVYTYLQHCTDSSSFFTP